VYIALTPCYIVYDLYRRHCGIVLFGVCVNVNCGITVSLNGSLNE